MAINLNSLNNSLKLLNKQFKRSSSSPSSSSSSSSSSSNSLSDSKFSYKITSPQKLFSSTGQSYDNFGISLGYHNDIAIVSSITRDYGGRVYIYYREGNHFI